jgi:hypothetical protein
MRNEILSPARRTKHTTRRLVDRFLAAPAVQPDELRDHLRGVGVPRHRIEEIIAKRGIHAVHS